MNKLLFFVFMSIVPFSTIDAQSIPESVFLDTIKARLITYKNPDGKILSERAFQKLMKPILSKIILNNEDAIKNGNSISFVNNADKSTISINSSLFLKNHPYQFINIGFSGNASNDFLFVKDKDKTNYGIEGNYTHSFRYNSGIYYNPEDALELEAKLKRYKSVLMAKYCKELAKSIMGLQAENATLQGQLDIETIDLSEKEALALADSITHNNARIAKFREWSANKQILIDAIENDLSDFEVKQVELTGHGVSWFEISGKPSVLGISFFDTSVVNLLQEGRQTYFKGTVTGSWNHARNTKRYSWFYSVGVNAFNNYFFEGIKSTDIQYGDIANRFFTVKGYDATHTDADAVYLTLNPFVNGYIYPFTNKIIGFELATDYKFNDLRNTHNFKAGVLFSITDKDDDVSKGTVGIFFIGKDIDYSEKVGSEFFSYGFRVGLPLNKIISLRK